MGRNLDENVYIEVPFRKDSPVLARLKEEIVQAQTSSKKKLFLGPFIAELLVRRDEQLYGEGSGDEWFKGMQVTPASLTEIVEQAVRSALVGVTLGVATSTVVQEEVSEQEIIEQEAAELADAWGGEDDWDALEE
jgi:hypothetical protein